MHPPLAMATMRGDSLRAAMETLDAKRVRGFFAEVIELNKTAVRPAAVVVTHLLPDRPFFIEAVEKICDIAAVFPKPKSENAEMRGWMQHKVNLQHLDRDRFSDPRHTVHTITSLVGDDKFVIADIGGYFSQGAPLLAETFSSQFLGVVEDTENGVQKYERHAANACPIIQVARSPLKNPEDFLVGQSIVFSTEALLREQGDILHGRTACVIGYGKLGRSIANLLNARHVRTVVYDHDHVRSVEALSHGFSVAPHLHHALNGAGLVFCATGNLGLKADDFALLERGAYVATVTSSDDELQTQDLQKEYRVRAVSDYVVEYRTNMHNFFLLNRGQAVNFIHGAAVGPFIYLVQAEIIASMQRLARETLGNGITESSDALRNAIAQAWYRYFGPSEWRRPQ